MLSGFLRSATKTIKLNMQISEEQLSHWAKAPSETEEQKCQNVVKQISDSILDKYGSDVSIFLQGSYKNRTNVRQDSDVDIVVLHENYFFSDVSFLDESEKSEYWKNFNGSQYTFQNFKSEVHDIANNTFGVSRVNRKNKCIRIDGNSYTVHADIVPCFVHKRIGKNNVTEAEGIEFEADSGIRTISFPKQHYDNGAEKNKNTNEMYKPVVRILKNVRNALLDNRLIGEDLMPSFFLECLVWNVLPHSHFDQNKYSEATKNILITLYQEMGEPTKANEYAEVSNLKWLLKGSPHRTYQQARDFLIKAWNHLGYEN